MNSNCILPSLHFIKKKDCINSDICLNFCDDDKILCNECNALFGKWRNGPSILKKTKDEQECPICQSKGECYFRPFCNHFLCIQCFQKFLYGIQPNKPTFPFKNKESEFWTNTEYQKQCQNDKSVILYLIDMKKYDDYIEKTKSFTSQCHQCRL